MNSKMTYKDYTLKAKVDNLDRFEIALGKLGATFKGVDHQIDTYFKTARGKWKHRKGTIENLITHYERIDEEGIEKTIVYQYDINPTKFQLDVLYKEEVIGIIEKIRKIYFIGSVKIHLDHLPDQTNYVEIEAVDKLDAFSNDELRDQCLRIKENLNIQDPTLIKTGYLMN